MDYILTAGDICKTKGSNRVTDGTLVEVLGPADYIGYPTDYTSMLKNGPEISVCEVHRIDERWNIPISRLILHFPVVNTDIPSIELPEVSDEVF